VGRLAVLVGAGAERVAAVGRLAVLVGAGAERVAAVGHLAVLVGAGAERVAAVGRLARVVSLTLAVELPKPEMNMLRLHPTAQRRLQRGCCSFSVEEDTDSANPLCSLTAYKLYTRVWTSALINLI
jgi:hypothetical protein